ncbi:site-specific integrase [Bacillus atrophaeus]|uniref:site-specific integrase n=1 Tax=Bacillus atrophaeus TaxID=1452 RepID=UPI001C62920E|nr:site-specific integrase [Bacillus atrophaeus]
MRPHTITYYLNELKCYQKYFIDQNLDTAPSKVTFKVIQENIILYMKEQGLKTVTINTHLRAIRSYFNFLYKQKHIRKNPVEGVRLLKDRSKLFRPSQLNS